MIMLPLTMLPSVRLENKSQLPPLPGVYYAKSGTRLLYVGESGNMQERWNSRQYGDHHMLAPLMHYRNVRLYYRPIKGTRTYRRHVEAKEINRLHPLLNRRKEKPDPFYNAIDFVQGLAIACTIAGFFYWVIGSLM